jgi:methyl-accepting chemotaxis protein
MRNLSVSKKVILGFSTLVLLVGVTGFAGYYASQRLYRHLEVASSVSLPSISLLLQIDRDLQQAVVAERSTIFTNPTAPEFERLVKEHGENLQQARDRWAQLKEIGLPPGAEALIKEYEARIEEWFATTSRVVAARVANTPEGRREALDLINQVASKQFPAARGCLDQLADMLEQQAEEHRLDGLATSQHATWASLGITAASVLIGLTLVWFLGVRLSRTLREIAATLAANAAQNAAAASQISSSSQALAQGATEQAASLEETSAALEEMSSMTKRNAEHAEAARNFSRQTREAAAHGSTEMRQMADAVSAIERSSDNIAAIIKTIDEIAFQTNILALNAAVEAARAGAAGAGFSVVADEVRSLAHRSAQAARETAEKIEESVRTSRQGTALSARVAQCLQDINTRTADVDRIVDEIASASGQQAQGIEQLTISVTQIDKVTQTNAAAAEESASASTELSAQATSLNEAINRLNELLGGHHEASRALSATKATDELPMVEEQPAQVRAVARPVAKPRAASRRSGDPKLEAFFK